VTKGNFEKIGTEKELLTGGGGDEKQRQIYLGRINSCPVGKCSEVGPAKKVKEKASRPCEGREKGKRAVWGGGERSGILAVPKKRVRPEKNPSGLE